MNKPLRPLVPEDVVKHAKPAVHLMRAAAAHVRAFATKSTPERVVEKMWGRDVATLEVLRVASTQATTTAIGWAKELAGVAILDLVQSATTVSAAAQLIERGLQLNMNGIAEFHVPARALNAAAAGQWTAEGAPTVARQLAFSAGAVLRPRKLSVITSYTYEQAESSNLENIVRATLSEATGLALDAQMFSANAGTAAAPAGLFNGVTPLTPTPVSGSTTPGEAAATDIGNLFAALAANGAGKAAVIVAAVPQATRLKLVAGPKDTDIIPSTALPSGTVAAIEVASFVSGFDSVPAFRASRDAAIHFEDTAPADPIMSGTPVRSMYQLDAIALRMDVMAAWAMRATGHAQYLTGALW